MTADRARRTVLVAGGTRGIGRAIGLAFARTGARVVLTHRWGSVDPAELRTEFAAAGAAVPEVVEADVGEPADTRRLLEHVGAGGVDVFVAAVCVVGKGDGTLSARTLRRSLSYSAWPLRDYVEAMVEAWGAPPRYAIALSSDGADHFYPGYDYVAASKAVLGRSAAGSRHGTRQRASTRCARDRSTPPAIVRCSARTRAERSAASRSSISPPTRWRRRRSRSRAAIWTGSPARW
jgi:NAD(P)-dependent dehydrogenase (short-subunit alcohol dehydrogenase family)